MELERLEGALCSRARQDPRRLLGLAFLFFTTAALAAPQATAPTFSPKGGTFTNSTPLTIATNTSGATIYYAWDGSTPTTASPVYASPLTVISSGTIKAFAVKPAMPNSAVSSAVFVINAALHSRTLRRAEGRSWTRSASPFPRTPRER